jgi:hypothetical protein
LDVSIAARSAKLQSLALIAEVIPSQQEGVFGCSGKKRVKVNGFTKK